VTEPLDMSKDPDRFVVGAEPAYPTGPLDPALDPDRFDPADQTLPQLLGKGAYEDERDNLQWLIGLLGVLGFLVLVSLLLQLG
jgi:hypothetical protein